MSADSFCVFNQCFFLKQNVLAMQMVHKFGSFYLDSVLFYSVRLAYKDILLPQNISLNISPEKVLVILVFTERN